MCTLYLTIGKQILESTQFPKLLILIIQQFYSVKTYYKALGLGNRVIKTENIQILKQLHIEIKTEKVDFACGGVGSKISIIQELQRYK